VAGLWEKQGDKMTLQEFFFNTTVHKFFFNETFNEMMARTCPKNMTCLVINGADMIGEIIFVLPVIFIIWLFLFSGIKTDRNEAKGK
jgi:hypothetical protein